MKGTACGNGVSVGAQKLVGKLLLNCLGGRRGNRSSVPASSTLAHFQVAAATEPPTDSHHARKQWVREREIVPGRRHRRLNRVRQPLILSQNIVLKIDSISAKATSDNRMTIGTVHIL